MKNPWEQVGVIGVDAGLCWVGDPCYIIGDNASNRMKKWSEFCDKIDHDAGVTQFEYCTGRDGLGVVVSTGYGDGVYPVYVRRNKEGRIMAVKVEFDE